jgi:hypothetical protein
MPIPSHALNDRGLRASQADILKNYFFSRSGTRIAEAKTMWNTMTVTIEPSVADADTDDDDGDEDENRIDPLVTYIRHLWVTGHGVTKERELAAKIRGEITNDTRTIGFLTDASGRAPNYMALLSSQHPKWIPYKGTTRETPNNVGVGTVWAVSASVVTAAFLVTVCVW